MFGNVMQREADRHTAHRMNWVLIGSPNLRVRWLAKRHACAASRIRYSMRSRGHADYVRYCVRLLQRVETITSMTRDKLSTLGIKV